MRGTKEVRDAMKPGDILQVDPKAELGPVMAGKLVIVQRVQSWGVDAELPGTVGAFPLTWQHVELTGGSVVWDVTGQKVRETTEPGRHHE